MTQKAYMLPWQLSWQPSWIFSDELAAHETRCISILLLFAVQIRFREGGVAQIWLLVQCLFAVTSLSSPSPLHLSPQPHLPPLSLSLSLPPHLFSIHHPSFTLNLHKLLCCLSPSAHCPCTTRASSRPLAPQRCFIYFNLIWCYLI